MCPSGATCLSAHCCFSELALLKSNSACWSRTKWTSSLKINLFLSWYSWKIAELALNNNHSLTIICIGHIVFGRIFMLFLYIWADLYIAFVIIQVHYSFSMIKEKENYDLIWKYFPINKLKLKKKTTENKKKKYRKIQIRYPIFYMYNSHKLLY
jgi:hypothetical protein